jgi:pyruvate/2-oxoacid:ferredoxin oxidoreductase alpha subunit
VKGTPDTRQNLITSIYLEPDLMEAHIRRMEAKYEQCRQLEQRHETYRAEDAEVLLVGYGIVSRLLRTVVDMARAQGIRAGLFRPVTLWPYPSRALAETSAKVRHILVVELSNGQMVEDVRLAVNCRVPVEFYGRFGGNVPSAEEIYAELVQRSAIATV